MVALVLLLLSSVFIGLFAGTQHKLDLEKNRNRDREEPVTTTTTLTVTTISTSTSVSTSTVPLPAPTHLPPEIPPEVSGSLCTKRDSETDSCIFYIRAFVSVQIALCYPLPSFLPLTSRKILAKTFTNTQVRLTRTLLRALC